MPRLTKIVPSPLVTIVVLTTLSICFGFDVRTAGDMGEQPSTLPAFLIPQIPLTLEPLMIILPCGVAAVDLLGSLMTAHIVDDLTDTSSDRNRECIGQGIANFATGLSAAWRVARRSASRLINVKSGGRGSTLPPASSAVLIVVLGDLVSLIPMPALVAIMITVSVGTLSWASIGNVRTHPRSSSIVVVYLAARPIRQTGRTHGMPCIPQVARKACP